MKQYLQYKQEGKKELLQRKKIRFAVWLGTIVLVMGILAIFPYQVLSQEKPAKSSGSAETSIANYDPVIYLVNRERQKYGLAPLQYNSQLAWAAQAKAQDIIENQYFDHFRPQDGRSPWDFIVEAG